MPGSLRAPKLGSHLFEEVAEPVLSRAVLAGCPEVGRNGTVPALAPPWASKRDGSAHEARRRWTSALERSVRPLARTSRPPRTPAGRSWTAPSSASSSC